MPLSITTLNCLNGFGVQLMFMFDYMNSIIETTIFSEMGILRWIII